MARYLCIPAHDWYINDHVTILRNGPPGVTQTCVKPLKKRHKISGLRIHYPLASSPSGIFPPRDPLAYRAPWGPLDSTRRRIVDEKSGGRTPSGRAGAPRGGGGGGSGGGGLGGGLGGGSDDGGGEWGEGSGRRRRHRRRRRRARRGRRHTPTQRDMRISRSSDRTVGHRSGSTQPIRRACVGARWRT